MNIFQHVKYEHLVAGISGGVTSTVILHPLDLLKIRFAVHDGQVSTRPQYRSLADAVVRIVRDEGVRGLYKGVTPNCWGAGAAWGFYFLFYNTLKAWMLEDNLKGSLGPGQHMLAAAESGVLTLIITNPMWVVKTRMCLQYMSPETVPSTIVHYSGMVDALKKVYKYEGIKGLYKGFTPGILGVSHGALQFMAYEEMKKSYTKYYGIPVNSKLGTLEYLGFAALSKLFAAGTTYPYQVVRARLQDQHRQYKGFLDVVFQTWRNEKFRGFYKGLTPSLLRVVPATAITFVVYENVSHFMLPDDK